MSLEEKNAVLTGANGGIGKAILETLTKEEINVWACVRKKTEEFEKFVCELAGKNNVWIEIIEFDLSDEDDITRGIKSIIREKKSIDILINNAGIPFGGLFQMTPMKKLKEVFNINYFAQVHIMQMISRCMMRQKKGCIINMASVGGVEVNEGYLAYGSSKAALIFATKCLAKEMGPYCIRVNAVAPGLTDTKMGNFKSSDELEKVVNRTSLRRMANPSEIADAVLFLSSDKASFITGQVLIVDGGRA